MKWAFGRGCPAQSCGQTRHMNYQQRIECHTLRSHEIRLRERIPQYGELKRADWLIRFYPPLSPGPKQRPLLRLKVAGAIFWSITKISQQSSMRGAKGCSRVKEGKLSLAVGSGFKTKMGGRRKKSAYQQTAQSTAIVMNRMNRTTIWCVACCCMCA